MIVRRGDLRPAHRGYRYQDLAAAYMFVRAMVERYDRVIVDRKQVEDDRVDDLEVVAGGQRYLDSSRSALTSTPGSQQPTSQVTDRAFASTAWFSPLRELALMRLPSTDYPQLGTRRTVTIPLLLS